MGFDLNQTPEDTLSQGNFPSTIPITIPSPITTIPSPITIPSPTIRDLNQYCLIDLNECYPEENDDEPEPIRHGNKKKNLTSDVKRRILEKLMQGSIDGKLHRGLITDTAARFGVGFRTASRLWNCAKLANANGDVVDISSKMVNRVGRKRIQLDLDRIKLIPLRKRTTIRGIAHELNLSTSTVHRLIKNGNLRPHSNALRPGLTDENKIGRVKFCLKMIDKGMDQSSNSFIDMLDRIHIDEKWFYITRRAQKYYLHAEEEEPLRTCKSKNFITKIMFLTAVARPRLGFDGKIGIWPFVVKEAAKRTSKNRKAGTMETKAMKSIDKDVMRCFLIEKLLPAIKKKWPFNNCKKIFIQQDNAKPHVHENDKEFLEAVRSYGLDIELLCQPPNSPDLNVLDLRFFSAISALHHTDAPTTVDEFIASVTRAFEIFSVEEANNVFITLQSCMKEILGIKGGIHYKITHMHKWRLIRDGQLPNVLECDPQELNEAREFIKEYEISQQSSSDLK
ncbi:uncharacterized protein LOC113324270 [Papaver somniferum]|uniref:uncharacterized protein LOC113324270 n=1 Tax=Papaver somniferum TaxID=3469 RepID=UPI000E6FC514|nr:uncharacterized protein LOC113324270 [Papaver somniferum]